jgi:hypothetical protein
LHERMGDRVRPRLRKLLWEARRERPHGLYAGHRSPAQAISQKASS